MYKFISLNQENLHLFKGLKKKDSVYVCGERTFQAIVTFDNYPIKNKNLAIKNVLRFLQYVDSIVGDHTLVQISSRKIREFFSGAQYRRYIYVLAALEIISRVPYTDGKYFEVTKRYCQYRLHDNYVHDKIGLVIAQTVLPPRLETDKKYPAKFEKTIQNMDCDFPGAVASEYQHYTENGMSANKLRIRLSKLFSINLKRTIKKGAKVDRLYHTFSNLSRISRKYLFIGNEKFIEIDIKNCQPLLLCFLIKLNGLAFDDNYLSDCEKGIFYETFLPDIKMTEAERKKLRGEIKVKLYKGIFFAFQPRLIIAKDFKRYYPLTYQSLQLLHLTKTTLACQLQNLEASIFNTLKPKESKFYFTLFDAIYFTDKADIPILTKQIYEKFGAYGITPKF